ncbi:glutamine-synthetase adenylyltransferase [Rhodobacteraceae bacterium WD3A24]|nr:glutamine-synthetase adenylyltransferase [Rhodobacteraceae bacterium WD3A24]
MSFAKRLTRAPIAFDPDAGAEAAARFPDLPGELRDLIAGTAGSSPHFNDLLAQEADWIGEALLRRPEEVLDEVIAAPEAADLRELGPALRIAKRRAALLCGLADLGGVWPLEEVTGALTRLADKAVHLAITRLVAEEIRRGKLPGAEAADAESGAGMVALAMGKMGAHELNFSSDIDLICLFDETRFEPDDYLDARAAFVRVTRKMAAMLSERGGEGYVFRTDLRLRPDAAVTPVCLSMDAAERYYESMGRTWERAAYIKARPCGGDIAAGETFLETLRPFVWRRHLDFAAIQDAHDMRLAIRKHKGLGGRLDLAGHDVKLGQGGIREIEFFTQTRQIIAGGREPRLRVRGTVEGLERLAETGWVPEEVTDALACHYRAHREVEHRLQMVDDAQTHRLPSRDEEFDRLARFMGEGDTDALREGLRDRFTAVAELAEGFFAPQSAEEGPELSERAQEVVDGWAHYPALRSTRAMEIFRRLRPEILGRLMRAADPEEALMEFDGFLRGLPAGVQLFSLFEANPQLIELVVDICTTAPRLAQYLSRNSGVFDAVIGGDFFDDWPGAAALAAQLDARLAEADDDYERQLDDARRWFKEWHFRVGVHHLRGLIDAFEAGKQYADLADAVLTAIWPVVVDEFARRHGPPPGRGAAVLAMGSLGAGRLNAASDLDLILIYDAAGADGSQGPRPLSNSAYYARLTKALVTALSAKMAEGRLYEVDMRLRPSGRQGPVATALSAFRNYQREEAWTWEHLALTRARPVAGEAELGEELEAFRRELIAEKAGGAIEADVVEMRARVRAARPGEGRWEAKDGPGGIQEIELAAQTGALKAGAPARRVEAQLRAGRRSGWISRDDEEALLDAYRLCWQFHCAARLLAERTPDITTLGEGAQSFLMRETDCDSPADLAERLAECKARAAEVIEAALTDPAHAG